ncbi:hypothetical protein N7523_005730 [Penicillium sp. IBT 18751x]|nr:hypothetical protein N7523_005730 [Penicillium sp. IBT 18751x]
MMTLKVALITGGASGIGLAVARILSARSNWEVHILDISQAGAQVAQEVRNIFFHSADVTQYDQLSGAFGEIFRAHKRLDFVFANAGVMERDNFYAQPPPGVEAISPPAKPDLSSIEVNLFAVINTSKLAHYYFRCSSAQNESANLVMTSSCGGLYPSYYSPVYSASKGMSSPLLYPILTGILAFMRSIAPAYANDGVRVNAICPGIVRTNLLDQTEWAGFPEEQFLSTERVANVVLQLVDGSQGLTDGKGAHRPESQLFGCTVEISTGGVYFQDPPEFCDAGMRNVMKATALENQVGIILNGN